MSLNYNSVIGTSPYNMLTKKHVVVKHLHAFWSKCWVHIPTKDAGGKVGHPRAYQARFIGYDMTTVTLEGKEEGSLKAKRSLLVRDANRRYASNFCKAAQTS